MDRPRNIGLCDELPDLQAWNAQDEIEVFRRAIDGDTSARDQLIYQGVRFAWTIARKYDRDYISRDDLAAEGVLALCENWRKFDPSRARWSTFAYWYCRKGIMAVIMRSERMRRMTPASMLNLDDESEDWDVDATSREDDPAETAGESERAARLMAEIDSLDPRSREILTARFGLGGSDVSSLRVLAKERGLSYERIRQIQDRAVKTLRQMLTQDDDEETPTATRNRWGRRSKTGRSARSGAGGNGFPPSGHARRRECEGKTHARVEPKMESTHRH